MAPDLGILLATAASIGFIHTLTGPDHYLPFIVMGKARKWTTLKTLWITFLCGLGHVGSSIVIGAIGIALGIGVAKLETVESFRGDLAAWAFIIFGFGYFLWGLWKAYKGSIHHAKKPVNLTPWILFTVFVLGPCEPLIPLLMYPAAKFHIGAVLLVTLAFSVCTIVTMLAVVYLTSRGIRFLPLNTFEKYMHAIAGATICLSGFAIVFLGL